MNWDPIATISWALCDPDVINGKKRPFTKIMDSIRNHSNAVVHDMRQLKLREVKKTRGDAWECFCVAWLKSFEIYKDVWLLKDVPIAIKQHLRITGIDKGIDIVIRTTDGEFIAVQCKYIDSNRSLTWASLATFLALVGAHPELWHKHIVLTTARKLSRNAELGVKTSCRFFSTFMRTTTKRYYSMIPSTGIPLQQGTSKPKSLQQLREARLKHYEKT